jgi:hypothetical protein
MECSLQNQHGGSSQWYLHSKEQKAVFPDLVSTYLQTAVCSSTPRRTCEGCGSTPQGSSACHRWYSHCLGTACYSCNLPDQQQGCNKRESGYRHGEARRNHHSSYLESPRRHLRYSGLGSQHHADHLNLPDKREWYSLSEGMSTEPVGESLRLCR